MASTIPGRKETAVARVNGADLNEVEDYFKKVFESQRRKWGAPLLPYPIYARRPTILKAVIGMWQGLAASGLLDPKLVALVNRRVASINSCLF